MIYMYKATSTHIFPNISKWKLPWIIMTPWHYWSYFANIYISSKVRIFDDVYIIGCHNILLKPIVSFSTTYGFVQMGDTSKMGNAHMLKSLPGVGGCGDEWSLMSFVQHGSLKKAFWVLRVWKRHPAGIHPLKMGRSPTRSWDIHLEPEMLQQLEYSTFGDTQIWRCLPPTKNATMGWFLPIFAWEDDENHWKE